MSTRAFTFENTKPVITDADLLADIRTIALQLRSESLPQQAYRQHGRYSTTAIKKRFGTWNEAITAAGLASAGRRDLPEAELFENLRDVWMALGRQPRKREMAKPISRFTHHPYTERYGGWLDAVKAFLVVAGSEENEPSAEPMTRTPRGPRDPSRLRFLVMRRDGFRCRHCGASPATTPGIELHIDHISAWVTGGATTIHNLQTLCVQCNLGKSDLKAGVSG